MNGADRIDDVVRSATASAALRPRRRLIGVARAATIAAVVLAAGLAGVGPAHAAAADGTTGDDIGTAPAIVEGSEANDIGTAPTPDGDTAVYDIGTAPTLEGDTVVYDIGTAPMPDGGTPVYDIGTPPLPADAPLLADLGVAVVASTPSPYVDHSFSWTVQVANNGAAPALAVVLTDLVPDQVTVIGVSSSDFTCSAVGNAVTCLRDELAAGSTGQITIDVMVPKSGTPQVVTNAASIASASVDATPANNSASSSVETVVVEIAAPAPTETAPASPVPVTTLAEAAPAGPTPTTTAAVPVPAFTDTLPLTGTSLQPLWLVASEALLLGLGLLFVARRRTVTAA